MNFYSGVLFGIYAFSAIYNLFLYFFNRERSSLALMWSTIFFSLYTLAMDFESSSRFESHAQIVTINLSVYFSIFFYGRFVFFFLEENETPFYSPNVRKNLQRILLAIYIPCAITNSILYFSESDEFVNNFMTFSMRLSDFVVLGLHLYFLITFLKNRAYRVKGVRFILLGEVALVCGMLFETIQVLFTEDSSYVVVVGVSIFLILLSISVADKINHLKKQKEQAQESALKNLEMKVQERTAEVVRQKLLIEEKQKDILDSIHYAKRIQQSLLPTEKYIFKSINRMKKDK